MKKRTPEEVISRLLETMGRSAAALEPFMLMVRHSSRSVRSGWSSSSKSRKRCAAYSAGLNGHSMPAEIQLLVQRDDAGIPSCCISSSCTRSHAKDRW